MKYKLDCKDNFKRRTNIKKNCSFYGLYKPWSMGNVYDANIFYKKQKNV